MSSAGMVLKLRAVVDANRKRVVFLNSVARGERVLSESERERMVAAEAEIRRLLDELAAGGLGVVQRMRVVSDAEVSRGREALPRDLVEQYELLFCRSFGSDPAVSVGDAGVIRGIGTPETVMRSDREQRTGGARAGGKKAGANTRAVVKDQRAYELKLRTDRKLRRLARDLRDELAGVETSTTARVCTHCARIGEQEWRWCPNCGHEMKDMER